MGKVFNALKRAEEAVDPAVMVREPEAFVAPVAEPVAPAERVRENGSGARPSAGAGGSPPRVFADSWKTSGPRTSRKGGSGKWDDRLALAATNGPVVESIRTLRTRILYPGSGRIPRSILVTSAAAGEGKSFVCANLGLSLAQGMDNYCLLVDCDLRSPSQHTLFGLGERPGLADYLQHKHPLPDLLSPSGVDKFSILTAGIRSINPAELLSSASMIELVDELEARYDDRIVLLDSPPLHVASETAVLAQHVDGVILVVRHGGARREHINALVSLIGREKILGIVFNAYTTNVLDYKVFGYYGYQQGTYNRDL
ncbi:MAG: CpsD/CapB family tyrosine-protein kinase [Desulfobulbus sp.]